MLSVLRRLSYLDPLTRLGQGWAVVHQFDLAGIGGRGEGLEIGWGADGGDLVTAHARVPTQAQLADPAVPLAPVRSIERLDPGESAEFTGEFRLPVEEIRPIPHGKAVVYVPLLRVRAEATGMAPVARTFVVGLKQPGAQRLQPFRLDEMPQTYHAVGQTTLD